MTSLTFYGGVNEIGGNKILLEDKDTKVFLDFGKSFSRRARYFEEFINPRTSNGITDFLTMGLVPDIQGVYRDDLMVMAGRKPQDPEIDAVLLTHAHSDHADYISFLHEGIPIYMGSACHLILKALAERANRTIEREILDYKPRPYSIKDKPIPRKINEFRTGDKFKIGSLEVEPIHVDHSVPGAYGFIIWTSEGPIAYTGDIRLHTSESTLNFEFIRSLEGRKLFQETICQILEQTSEEKIEYYKKLLIHAYNLPDPDKELIISYKHILDTLQVTDIVILKNLYSPDDMCRKIMEKNKGNGGDVTNFALKNGMWDVLNIDQRLFEKLIVKLESDNLISQRDRQHWAQGSYHNHELEEGIINMTKDAHNLLTNYGLGFIKFIIREK